MKTRWHSVKRPLAYSRIIKRTSAISVGVKMVDGYCLLQKIWFVYGTLHKRWMRIQKNLSNSLPKLVRKQGKFRAVHFWRPIYLMWVKMILRTCWWENMNRCMSGKFKDIILRVRHKAQLSCFPRRDVIMQVSFASLHVWMQMILNRCWLPAVVQRLKIIWACGTWRCTK